MIYGDEDAGLNSADSQIWSQDSPGIAGTSEASDGFGTALAVGDFNGDQHADLAISAIGEAIGSAAAAN